MPGNLWPDFPVSQEPRTIRRIIQEEGSGISDKTEGKIKFSVVSDISEERIIHNCYLVVDLIHYRYPLMRIFHGLEQYPVTLESDAFEQPVVADSEDEFVNRLTQVFRSPQTVNAVTQLLSLLS